MVSLELEPLSDIQSSGIKEFQPILEKSRYVEYFQNKIESSKNCFEINFRR